MDVRIPLMIWLSINTAISLVMLVILLLIELSTDHTLLVGESSALIRAIEIPLVLLGSSLNIGGLSYLTYGVLKNLYNKYST